MVRAILKQQQTET